MVEWKKLGEIGKCMAGATPSTKESSYWDNGTIPWMSSGEVHQGVVKSTSALITQKGYDNSSTKMLPSGTVVIALAGQGKTRGTVAITAIELCTNQSLCGVVIDNDSIINKYVYYYLKTRYDDLRRISSGEGTRGGLNLKMIGSYLIPVPSLSEQKRIVGIFDTFTSSIENLKEQIAQRRKQYEYYRDQLLDLEGKEGVEMKTLGEICTKITDGSHFSPQPVEQGYYMPSVKDMRSNGFDFSSCKQISKVDYENLVNNGCKPRLNDVLVAKDGSMLKYVFPVIKEENIVVLSSIAILSPKHELINSKYLSYYLMQQKIKDKTIREFSSKGGVPRIILKNFKKFIVEYPSLSEQQRIVDILDKFEESIQNLEAQLKEREKQYEYYRNKLLTFE